MLHLLKMCNAHHKSNTTQECHNLKDRLPEAGVLQQLRDDRNSGDVNESTGSEGQDPRDGGLIWYDGKDVRGKLRFWMCLMASQSHFKGIINMKTSDINEICLDDHKTVNIPAPSASSEMRVPVSAPTAVTSCNIIAYKQHNHQLNLSQSDNCIYPMLIIL